MKGFIAVLAAIVAVPLIAGAALSVGTTFNDLEIVAHPSNGQTGIFKVGDGAPTNTQDGEDAYIEGMLEVDGSVYFDGTWGTQAKVLTEDYTTTGTANTITAAENGTTFFVSESSDDVVNFVLPSAAAGLIFTFIDNDATAGADLTIDPASGDSLNGDTAGDGIACTSDAVGQSITYLAVDATTWVPINTVGTWTAE